LGGLFSCGVPLVVGQTTHKGQPFCQNLCVCSLPVGLQGGDLSVFFFIPPHPHTKTTPNPVFLWMLNYPPGSQPPPRAVGIFGFGAGRYFYCVLCPPLVAVLFVSKKTTPCCWLFAALGGVAGSFLVFGGHSRGGFFFFNPGTPILKQTQTLGLPTRWGIDQCCLKPTAMGVAGDTMGDGLWQPTQAGPPPFHRLFVLLFF